MNDTPQTTVQCPPAKDPAVRWFIFAAMMLGFAAWCYSDRRPTPEAWDLEHINDVLAYLMNNWGPILLVPVGLISAAMGIRHLTRTAVADEQSITYGGQTVLWNQITLLDASQLTSKKVLVLHYNEDDTLTLDSWKLQNFKELVAFIESHLSEDVKRTA